MTGAPSIAQRAANAGIRSISGMLVARLIDLLTLLLLTRLLGPADFGLVAMAMTVILLLEAVTDMPLIQPILRMRDPGPEDYGTAFTLGLIRAALIGGAVALLALPLARFYGDPRLVLLLLALALAPMLRSLFSPRLADFHRRFDMRPGFWMDIGGKLAAFAMVTILALTSGSYWAIAIGTITTPLVMALLSYRFAPYRPRLTLCRWRSFADVLGWHSLGQLCAALNQQIDRILLGRLVPAETLGRYSIAGDLTNIPWAALVLPLYRPLLPALSRAKDSAHRAEIFGKYANAALFLVGPVLVLIAFLSEPIVAILLGPAWAETARFLFWLPLSLLPMVPAAGLAPLAILSYRARLPALRLMTEAALRLPLTLLGILAFGPIGAIAARGAAAVLHYLFTLRAVKSLTGMRCRTQIRHLWRSICGLGLLALSLHLTAPGSASPFPALQMIGAAIAGTALYLGMTLTLWRLSGRPAGIESLLLSRLKTAGTEPESDPPNAASNEGARVS